MTDEPMLSRPCRSLSRREAGRIFERLVERLDQPLLVVDSSDHQLLRVNRRACHLFGRHRSDLLGSPVEAILPDAWPLLRSLSEASEGEKAREVVLPRSRRSPGCELKAYAVPLGQGEAYLVLGQERPEPGEAASDDDLIETNLEFPTIIGESDRIREICRLIGLVAKTETTVLVQGESGTGKELVAQAIHFHSHRRRRPLVEVNCSALSDTLLESELFGHKKGAFTGAIQHRKGRFQHADRGTIILDEIDSMSPAGQAKLLRVLQEREFEPVGTSETVRVDVRVVGVTNADLEAAIEAGRFRQDLYYRLNAFPIRLPPLRERREDIPLLAQHFLRRCAASVRKEVRTISLQAISALIDYHWPGNVRELANAIEYSVILERGTELRWESLPEKLKGPERRERSLRERLNREEKKMILEALSQAGGVQNRAAKLLGMDRRNLSYFLNKHQIHRQWRARGATAGGAK